MDTKLTKYKPVFARVLIERELKKSSSIIIPDGAAKRNAPSSGVIVALGETASQTLQVGQKVLFGKHAGAWLDPTKEGDDGTLYICQDEDILAIIGE
jgi:co-chaperonin GroES (HSP10)